MHRQADTQPAWLTAQRDYELKILLRVALCRSPAHALPIDSSESNVKPPSSSEVRAVRLATAHTVTERRDKQSPMFVQLATREQFMKVYRERRIVEVLVAHARTPRLTDASDRRAQDRSSFAKTSAGGSTFSSRNASLRMQLVIDPVCLFELA